MILVYICTRTALVVYIPRRLRTAAIFILENLYLFLSFIFFIFYLFLSFFLSYIFIIQTTELFHELRIQAIREQSVAQFSKLLADHAERFRNN